jgi:hypothetical protein
MTFEVVKEVNMSILVLWVVTQCDGHQRFGVTYCPHLRLSIQTESFEGNITYRTFSSALKLLHSKAVA